MYLVCCKHLSVRTLQCSWTVQCLTPCFSRVPEMSSNCNLHRQCCVVFSTIYIQNKLWWIDFSIPANSLRTEQALSPWPCSLLWPLGSIVWYYEMLSGLKKVWISGLLSHFDWFRSLPPIFTAYVDRSVISTCFVLLDCFLTVQGVWTLKGRHHPGGFILGVTFWFKTFCAHG